MSVVPGESVDPDADGLVAGVTIWPSNSLPSAKYQFCKGALLLRADYSLLYSRIGTAHNTGGEAATEFRLPNNQGKFLVGLNSADADFDTVGETGGTKVATMPTHGHTLSGAPGVGTLAVSPSSHDHTYTLPPALNILEGSGTLTTVTGGGSNPSTGAASLSISGAPSAGTLAAGDAAGSGNNCPPYRVVNTIIKVL